MSAAIYPNHIIAVADAAAVLSQAQKKYTAARSTGCHEKTEAAGLILDAAQIAYTAAREASAKIKESESPKAIPAAVVIPAAKPAKKQPKQKSVAADADVFFPADTHIGALIQYNYWLTKFFEQCI